MLIDSKNCDGKGTNKKMDGLLKKKNRLWYMSKYGLGLIREMIG